MLTVPADWGLVPESFLIAGPCTNSLNSLVAALYNTKETIASEPFALQLQSDNRFNNVMIPKWQS